MFKLATTEQKEFYNKIMYPFQDEIFGLMTSNKFYLTGGTCLSRFYFHHRYSDDLDFFFDGSKFSKQSFETEFNIISTEIKRRHESKVLIHDEYFKRLMIYKKDYELKCEFVYDPTVSINQRITIEPYQFLLDTKENIIANKLCAIYNRKTYKDYIDLIYLTKEFELQQAINWSEEKMVPIDYEGAIMCLIEGDLSGNLIMFDKIDEHFFTDFIKELTTKLIHHARSL
jgi:predicted nucleotidyltransferase component of viral defense system